jgi:hypothetical protein
LIDAWVGDDSGGGDDGAPPFVIVIAVLVGGLITATCMSVIIYMIVKAWRNRKK